MQPKLEASGFAVYYDYPRYPSTRIIPTLGPKVCKSSLHGATWIPRDYVIFMIPQASTSGSALSMKVRQGL